MRAVNRKKLIVGRYDLNSAAVFESISGGLC